MGFFEYDRHPPYIESSYKLGGGHVASTWQFLGQSVSGNTPKGFQSQKCGTNVDLGTSSIAVLNCQSQEVRKAKNFTMGQMKFRKSRLNKFDGGVVIAIKSSLPFGETEVDSPCPVCSTQHERHLSQVIYIMNKITFMVLWGGKCYIAVIVL